jgi:hypothetical protein
MSIAPWFLNGWFLWRPACHSYVFDTGRCCKLSEYSLRCGCIAFVHWLSFMLLNNVTFRLPNEFIEQLL